jgi:hypothetical protein
VSVHAQPPPGHPFDLTKTRLQTAPAGVYTGAIDVVKKTVAKDGITGCGFLAQPPLIFFAQEFQVVSRNGPATTRGHSNICHFFLGEPCSSALYPSLIRTPPRRPMMPRRNSLSPRRRTGRRTCCRYLNSQRPDSCLLSQRPWSPPLLKEQKSCSKYVLFLSQVGLV